MNYGKRPDILEKQNIKLFQELNECKKKIKQYDTKNKKQKDEFENLIKCLNNLRKDWYHLNAELRKKNDEYEQILIEVRIMRNAILSHSIKFVIKRIFKTIFWSLTNFIKRINRKTI